ncbi:CHASE2 domain-containing protein [Dankookia rubra]|uniref:CHASE2 domain-containing protein n=1 Tax=Dankookia rubra TaxID=1442381 RepID=A0A4R5QGE8_9PROT|nr:CHASE2 domain-containing protein [Dankookia rubra]TDH61631.1 CHASE2 domain-containing protein [Dankookia rubra]
MPDGHDHGKDSDGEPLTLRGAAVRFVSGIMLGVLFAGIMQLLSPLAFIQHLNRLGSDLVISLASMKSDAFIRPGVPRIIFVSIDDATLEDWVANSAREARGRIAAMIDTLRGSGAAAIMLDIVFEDSSPGDAAMRAALSRDGAPMLLASPIIASTQAGRIAPAPVAPGPAYPSPLPPGIRFASDQVLRDTDGVVRSLPPMRCIKVDGIWQDLPSLARGTAALFRPEPDAGHAPCVDDHAHEEPISFLIRPEHGLATAPVAANPWFRTVSAVDLPKLSKDLLRNAIVVVGQDNQGSEADRFLTPLGEMPGALLQANALAGLLHTGALAHAGTREHLVLEIMLILVAASIGVLYWLLSRIACLCLARLLPRRWVGSNPKRSFVALLADLLIFAAMTALAVACVVFVSLETALAALTRGQVGLLSLVPVIAVALEALVEVGELLMIWIHRGASWIVGRVWAGAALLRSLGGRRARAAATVLGVLLPGWAAAEDKAPAALLRIVSGDPDRVEVERPGHNGTLTGRNVLDLYPRDTVRVLDRGTRVKVLYLGERKQPFVELDGRPGLQYTVEASQASPESWQLWRPLRALFEAFQRDPPQPHEARAASMAGISNLTGGTVAARQATSRPPLGEDLAMSANRGGTGAEPGDWQIDLGGFAENTEARSAATAAQMALGLPSAGIAVVAVQRAGARLWRARIAGLDQFDALEACAKLRPRSSCAVVSPEEATAAVVPLLRHAGGLADTSYFIAAGEVDFPVVWAGGTGPFVVQVLGPEGNSVLASQTIRGSRMARVAIAALGPAGKGRVRVADQADDKAILLTVTVARQPKLSAGSLGQALPLPAAAYLYSEAPGWRIEGLRRFMALAEAGDTDAQQVLEGVMAR